MVNIANPHYVQVGCDVISNTGTGQFLSLLLIAQFVMSFLLWGCHPLFETNTGSDVRIGIVYKIMVKRGSDLVHGKLRNTNATYRFLFACV